jgi:hypothetical protein
MYLSLPYVGNNTESTVQYSSVGVTGNNNIKTHETSNKWSSRLHQGYS